MNKLNYNAGIPLSAATRTSVFFVSKRRLDVNEKLYPLRTDRSKRKSLRTM